MNHIVYIILGNATAYTVHVLHIWAQENVFELNANI